jgi:hypothetical protein
MNEPESHDIEDLEACARDNRRPRETGPYRVLIGDALLNFEPHIAHEAVHTGRSLLDLAAIHPPEHHAFFAVMVDGLLEEIRLEEAIDLRGGVERFLVFRSDRIFRFILDEREYHWGGAFISGATLLSLAKVAPDSHRVCHHQPDGEQRIIELRHLVDLAQPGVEVFSTRQLE